MGQEQRTIVLPLTTLVWAVLQIPVPMSEESWQLLLAILGAMKPGLVRAEERQEATHGR